MLKGYTFWFFDMTNGIIPLFKITFALIYKVYTIEFVGYTNFMLFDYNSKMVTSELDTILDTKGLSENPYKNIGSKNLYLYITADVTTFDIENLKDNTNINKYTLPLYTGDIDKEKFITEDDNLPDDQAKIVDGRYMCQITKIYHYDDGNITYTTITNNISIPTGFNNFAKQYYLYGSTDGRTFTQLIRGLAFNDVNFKDIGCTVAFSFI